VRKIIVVTMVSLDNVMQAPGDPAEDTSEGFTLGGWTVPYADDFFGKVLDEEMNKPFDLLLGRKTFEIFASYWRQHDDEGPGPGINKAVKYVASNTLTSHDWGKCVFFESASLVKEIKNLKQQDGPDLWVYGSSNLIQTLLKNDLVDEFWLRTFPVILGNGKKLFAEGTPPAAFTLTDSKTSPAGVVFASYQRAGEVKTGSF